MSYLVYPSTQSRVFQHLTAGRFGFDHNASDQFVAVTNTRLFLFDASGDDLRIVSDQPLFGFVAAVTTLKRSGDNDLLVILFTNGRLAILQFASDRRFKLLDSRIVLPTDDGKNPAASLAIHPSNSFLVVSSVIQHYRLVFLHNNGEKIGELGPLGADKWELYGAEEIWTDLGATDLRVTARLWLTGDDECGPTDYQAYLDSNVKLWQSFGGPNPQLGGVLHCTTPNAKHIPKPIRDYLQQHQPLSLRGGSTIVITQPDHGPEMLEAVVVQLPTTTAATTAPDPDDGDDVEAYNEVVFIRLLHSWVAIRYGLQLCPSPSGSRLFPRHKIAALCWPSAPPHSSPITSWCLLNNDSTESLPGLLYSTEDGKLWRWQLSPDDLTDRRAIKTAIALPSAARQLHKQQQVRLGLRMFCSNIEFTRRQRILPQDTSTTTSQQQQLASHPVANLPVSSEDVDIELDDGGVAVVQGHPATAAVTTAIGHIATGIPNNTNNDDEDGGNEGDNNEGLQQEKLYINPPIDWPGATGVSVIDLVDTEPGGYRSKALEGYGRFSDDDEESDVVVMHGVLSECGTVGEQIDSMQAFPTTNNNLIACITPHGSLKTLRWDPHSQYYYPLHHLEASGSLYHGMLHTNTTIFADDNPPPSSSSSCIVAASRARSTLGTLPHVFASAHVSQNTHITEHAFINVPGNIQLVTGPKLQVDINDHQMHASKEAIKDAVHQHYALSVLCPTPRPEVLFDTTTTGPSSDEEDIQGVTGVWALKKKYTDVEDAFVVASFVNGSRALAVNSGGEFIDATDVLEIDACSQTLSIGNLPGRCGYGVQVTPTAVRAFPILLPAPAPCTTTTTMLTDDGDGDNNSQMVVCSQVYIWQRQGSSTIPLSPSHRAVPSISVATVTRGIIAVHYSGIHELVLLAHTTTTTTTTNIKTNSIGNGMGGLYEVARLHTGEEVSCISPAGQLDNGNLVIACGSYRPSLLVIEIQKQQQHDEEGGGVGCVLYIGARVIYSAELEATIQFEPPSSTTSSSSLVLLPQQQQQQQQQQQHGGSIIMPSSPLAAAVAGLKSQTAPIPESILLHIFKTNTSRNSSSTSGGGGIDDNNSGSGVQISIAVALRSGELSHYTLTSNSTTSSGGRTDTTMVWNCSIPPSSRSLGTLPATLLPLPIHTGTNNSTAAGSSTSKMSGQQRVEGIAVSSEGAALITLSSSSSITTTNTTNSSASTVVEPSVSVQPLHLHRVMKAAVLQLCSSELTGGGGGGNSNLASQESMEMKIDSPTQEQEEVKADISKPLPLLVSHQKQHQHPQQQQHQPKTESYLFCCTSTGGFRLVSIQPSCLTQTLLQRFPITANSITAVVDGPQPNQAVVGGKLISVEIPSVVLSTLLPEPLVGVNAVVGDDKNSGGGGVAGGSIVERSGLWESQSELLKVIQLYRPQPFDKTILAVYDIHTGQQVSILPKEHLYPSESTTAVIKLSTPLSFTTPPPPEPKYIFQHVSTHVHPDGNKSKTTAKRVLLPPPPQPPPPKVVLYVVGTQHGREDELGEVEYKGRLLIVAHTTTPSPNNTIGTTGTDTTMNDGTTSTPAGGSGSGSTSATTINTADDTTTTNINTQKPELMEVVGGLDLPHTVDAICQLPTNTLFTAAATEAAKHIGTQLPEINNNDDDEGNNRVVKGGKLRMLAAMGLKLVSFEVTRSENGKYLLRRAAWAHLNQPATSIQAYPSGLILVTDIKEGITQYQYSITLHYDTTTIQPYDPFADTYDKHYQQHRAAISVEAILVSRCDTICRTAIGASLLSTSSGSGGGGGGTIASGSNSNNNNTSNEQTITSTANVSSSVDKSVTVVFDAAGSVGLVQPQHDLHERALQTLVSFNTGVEGAFLLTPPHRHHHHYSSSGGGEKEQQEEEKEEAGGSGNGDGDSGDILIRKKRSSMDNMEISQLTNKTTTNIDSTQQHTNLNNNNADVASTTTEGVVLGVPDSSSSGNTPVCVTKDGTVWYLRHIPIHFLSSLTALQHALIQHPVTCPIGCSGGGGGNNKSILLYERYRYSYLGRTAAWQDVGKRVYQHPKPQEMTTGVTDSDNSSGGGSDGGSEHMMAEVVSGGGISTRQQQEQEQQGSVKVKLLKNNGDDGSGGESVSLLDGELLLEFLAVPLGVQVELVVAAGLVGRTGDGVVAARGMERLLHDLMIASTQS